MMTSNKSAADRRRAGAPTSSAKPVSGKAVGAVVDVAVAVVMLRVSTASV